MVEVKVGVKIELNLGPHPLYKLPRFLNTIYFFFRVKVMAKVRVKFRIKVRVGVKIRVRATPNYKLPNFTPPTKRGEGGISSWKAKEQELESD